jgi:hypothetical protein
MKTLIILFSLFLTGCGTCTHHCIMGFGPGNKMFDAMGDHANTMDPCQHYGKPDGYKLADFCFANAGKKVYHIKDTNGKILYKVQ